MVEKTTIHISINFNLSDAWPTIDIGFCTSD